MHAGFPGVVVGKELFVLFADHGAAGAGGGDDVVVGLEDLDHALGEGLGLGVEAVVEEGLAAAGLGGGEGDAAAVVLEDLGDGDADVGVELVGEAGDEEGDVHR